MGRFALRVIKGMLGYNKKYIKPGLAGFASLAILAFPVVGTSAITDTVDIAATLGSTISIATTDPASISVTPTSGGVQSSQNGTVTVSTNNADGYNLAISAATTTLDTTGDSIPASAGTAAAPIALANNTWGYRVDNEAGFGSGDSSTPLLNATSSALTYAGVTSGAVQLKTTAEPAASDVTTVSYSIKANSSQQSGAYTGQVTYTAVTN